MKEDNVWLPKELTAENGAKALLLGEFKEGFYAECGNCDGHGSFEDGGTCLVCGGSGNYQFDVPIQWTTIKEIYAMVVKHYANSTEQ